eukprot:349651-Chlamydomonas_euryale.AAC.3
MAQPASTPASVLFSVQSILPILSSCYAALSKVLQQKGVWETPSPLKRGLGASRMSAFLLH